MIESLRLATVQGEEAKLVVVSLVRANKQRKISFLRTENRINVLVSRAQHGLFMVGNADTYRSVGMWSEIHDKPAASHAVGEALKAFQHTLRHQLAIVQGPPGTGKTRTILSAINVILSSRAMAGRKAPIVVSE